MLQLISLIIYKKQNMDEDEYRETEHQKAIYTKTTIKKKEQLIDLVLNQNYTIYKASKILKISNSTAKSAIMNFQKYGVVLNRNTAIEYEKVKAKERDSKNDSETVKIEENDAQYPLKNLSIVDSDRLRILGNMGITNLDESIAANMPFYNYPLG